MLDVPINSAVSKGVISSGTTPTATFTPDNPATPGCYRVKLTVVGLDGSRSSMIRNFCVQTAQGWVLASFRSTAAELNFNGNTDGWETYLNTILLSLSAGAPSSVLRQNTVFVSKNGNDGTGTRNSLTTPFLTIAAGLAAAQAGDTVQVGSGTYAEDDLDWPELNWVQLVGAGGANTTIQSSAGTNSINIAPTAAAVTGGALIKDIFFWNSGAGASGVSIDCTAQPTSFDGGVAIVDCAFVNSVDAPGVLVRTCNQVLLRNVNGKDVSWDIKNCAKGYAYDSLVNNITVDWDAATDPPSGTRGAFAMTGVQSKGTLTVNGEGWVGMGNDCQVAAIAGALGDDASIHGIIDFMGRCVGGVAVTFDFQNAMGSGFHRAVKLPHADIGGTVSVADVGTSSQRCQVTAQHAIFRTTTNQTITAGAWCDMDLRTASFVADALAVAGDGTIDRSIHRQYVAAGTVLPLTMTIADTSGNPVPFPDLSAVGGTPTHYPYSVSFEYLAAPPGPDFPLYVSSKPKAGATTVIDGAATPTNATVWVTLLRDMDNYVF
jgi:hypothetical protein